MKNLIIAAWLTVLISLSASTARAADWTNGKFSCDINVVETSHWPFTWGTWKKITMSFSQNGKPYIVYECSENGSLYSLLCKHQSNSDPDYWRLFKRDGYIYIRPNISNWTTCDYAFEKLHQK
ncbi:MAG: hypothetical protein PHH91_07325 [Desulfuromonadaceae bacterium]|nr:hypothetical protein [Desulfuromonadaceae bacterium]